jgi:hypothetical protein
MFVDAKDAFASHVERKIWCGGRHALLPQPPTVARQNPRTIPKLCVRRCAAGPGLLACDQATCPKQDTIEGDRVAHYFRSISEVDDLVNSLAQGN